MKIQNVAFLEAEHETLVSNKSIIPPSFPCPSWDYTFRTSCLSSTFQNASSVAQYDTSWSIFCCKLKCPISNMKCA